MNWFSTALLWYIVTLVATIACMPVTLLLFRRVMGQGAGFARPVAMIVSIWPIWFLSHVFDGLWNGPALWLSVAVVGSVGWVFVWRARWVNADTVFHYGVAELVHLFVFCVGIWLKGFVPMVSVLSGTDTEKPGELMMLSSVMHSTSMPPQDAWLSGHTINYYYLGYGIWGGFGKMFGGVPAEVFNLALISTFAMAFVAIAGLVATVVGRYHGAWAARVGGLVAASIALIIGNPWSSFKVLNREAGDYWGGVGWRASRVIRDSADPDYGLNPITEFPSFSFILGDLHPHVLALPFAATVLGLAWMLLTLGRTPIGTSFWRAQGPRIAVAGGVAGAMYVLNSWDFPTYSGIALLALGIGTVGTGWRHQLGALALFVGSAIVAWLPFHLDFEAPARPLDSSFHTLVGKLPIVGGVLESIGVWQGLATSPDEFFSIFGFQYSILLAMLLVFALRRQHPVFSRRLWREGERPAYDPAPQYLALGFGVLCMIGALVVPIPLLLFCGLPVIVIWLLLERDSRLTPANVSLVLFALALLLLLVPEFFYISDIYTGSRMNTVFKVSYQVWLLMSVASGIGVVAMWKSVRFNAVLRYALPAVTGAMLIVALAYPVVASRQWMEYRNPDGGWIGLNGLEHLQQSPYSGEYAAIQWLLENSDTDDVILTAGGGDWRPDVARISSTTGVPTLMGWIGHEQQWHLGNDRVLERMPQRIYDIDALYAGPPSVELLDRYGITLIYMGPTETSGATGVTSSPGRMSTVPVPTASDPAYPGPGWELVFDQDGARIWRRVAD